VNRVIDPPVWQTARFRLVLDRPRVMAIVNVTPDSFATGGGAASPADLARRAIAHAEAQCRDGAELLDIGGESTRPGAAPVLPDEELARVLPVVRAAVGFGIPVSVDTSAPAVMRAALDAGADVVNDVRALRRPGALAAIASHPAAGVVAMHMRGEPATMQQQTDYRDVVAEVAAFLATRLDAFEAAGIARERVALDPGIGFAKTAEQNFELLRRQAELRACGRPLLLGWSRKSALGVLTGRPVGERLPASIAAALMAAQHGAAILRVHDVAATIDALAVWRAAQPLPAAPAENR
jgi:dihydropteroate synthase